MSITTPENLIQVSLLGEAIDHASMAVFVFDEVGRYAAVNEHACELLGYTRAELLALRLGDLSTLPREETIRRYTEIVGGRAGIGETRVRTRSGEELTLGFHARATRISGMPFYVAVAWRAE